MWHEYSLSRTYEKVSIKGERIKGGVSTCMQMKRAYTNILDDCNSHGMQSRKHIFITYLFIIIIVVADGTACDKHCCDYKNETRGSELKKSERCDAI